MRQLQELRHHCSAPTQLVLLPPIHEAVGAPFARAQDSIMEYSILLSMLQRLRGSVYLNDGAIESRHLTPDGRHEQAGDLESWHIITVDGSGQVCGCVRYRHFTNGVEFGDLTVSDSALARSDRWGYALRAAVESELAHARRDGCGFGEVGGWAIAPERRGTTDALRVALATFGLGQLLGGSRSISTATFRHGSATILQRIGGRPLDCAGMQLPAYYDPQYKCDMFALLFDSARPPAKYRAWIDELRDELVTAPVFCARAKFQISPAPRRYALPGLPAGSRTPGALAALAAAV